MATAKIQTGLRLEEELYEKLKALSSMEGRSINNLMEYIARRYIAEYEEQNGPLPRYQD